MEKIRLCVLDPLPPDKNVFISNYVKIRFSNWPPPSFKSDVLIYFRIHSTSLGICIFRQELPLCWTAATQIRRWMNIEHCVSFPLALPHSNCREWRVSIPNISVKCCGIACRTGTSFCFSADSIFWWIHWCSTAAPRRTWTSSSPANAFWFGLDGISYLRSLNHCWRSSLRLPFYNQLSDNANTHLQKEISLKKSYFWAFYHSKLRWKIIHFFIRNFYPIFSRKTW